MSEDGGDGFGFEVALFAFDDIFWGDTAFGKIDVAYMSSTEKKTRGYYLERRFEVKKGLRWMYLFLYPHEAQRRLHSCPPG